MATRVGRAILAQAEGIRFEASTGQLLLDNVYARADAAATEKSREAQRDLKREHLALKRKAPKQPGLSGSMIPLQGVRR